MSGSGNPGGPDASAGSSWQAEARVPSGKLAFHFNREASKGVVVTVEAEQDAVFTVPEIRRLHAALGNVLAELD